MSEIGNISKSYGKQVNISVANTYSSTVLDSTLLPAQSIIITAPVVSYNGTTTDLGTYCLVATDANKTPVRLTYTIQPGNGLVIDTDNTDILKFTIDETTLRTGSNGELQLDVEDFIDNSTVEFDNSKMSINTQNLPIADENNFGVVSIDGESTKLSLGNNLYVDTEGLIKANDNTAGVVTSDKKTIHIDTNGVVSVNTKNLSTASQTNYGVVKIDGRTIGITSYGNVYVITDNLGRGSSTYYGIVKPDGRIVNVNNGKLYLDTDGIQHATNTTYGTMKVDGITLTSDNGVISMPKYDALISDISDCSKTLSQLENSINKLNEKLSQIV